MNGPIQPDYITFDLKAREALLSQVGSLTPVEREIFHRIIKMWSPEISYHTILNIISSESVTAKNDIELLMRKLRSARMGLLTTTLQEGNSVPHQIILTNPDDYYFYHKLVEEELMEVVYNLVLPLPSKQSLAEKGIIIPPQYLTETSYQMLATLNSQKEAAEHHIFQITAGGPDLYLTSFTIKRFVTVALAKMQAYLQNSNLLSLIAQIKNTALLDIKRQVEARDPGFWTQMTKEIIDNQDTIKQNRKVIVDEQFWSIAYFLNNFLFNQMEETRRRKAEEEEKALDMKAIADQIKAAPTFLVSDESFSEILMSYKNKHPDNFASFKKEFEDRYLQTPERKSLPILVHSSRSYIHQDNVQAFFLVNLDKGGREFFAAYVKLMEQYLKNPAGVMTTAFYSSDNFQNDLKERVKQADPLMHELLQRPNLVAEAIILTSKKNKDVKTSEDLKSSLAPFFYSDRIRFRELTVLYGLNIIDIFQIAFMKLSIFRQIIMKVSGKYESHYKRFDDFIEYSFNELPNREKIHDTGDTLAEPIRRKPGMVNVKSANQNEKDVTRKKAGRGTTPEIKKVPKNYSRTEQDSAWKNFQKSIKK